MNTHWQAVVFVAVMAAVAVSGCALVSRSADKRMDLLRRRSGSPSGPAGTGLERAPAAPGQAQVMPAALPRSPIDPAGGAVDPRPTAPPAGAGIPAATVVAPHAVAAGLQRRRVILHG